MGTGWLSVQEENVGVKEARSVMPKPDIIGHLVASKVVLARHFSLFGRAQRSLM
jgi:hypothetical protein